MQFIAVMTNAKYGHRQPGKLLVSMAYHTGFFIFFPCKESEESKITYSGLRRVARSRKAYSRTTTQYFYVKGTDNQFLWRAYKPKCLITEW